MNLAADANGITTVRSPFALCAALVSAWAVALVWAIFNGYWLLSDFRGITSPGVTAVAVLAAVCSLPDLWPLLIGHLHRWQLLLTPTHITYRGYRADVIHPWSQVAGATIQLRKLAGVRIDVKEAGDNFVIPYTAFRLPADQFVDLIMSYRDCALRRARTFRRLARKHRRHSRVSKQLRSK